MLTLPVQPKLRTARLFASAEKKCRRDLVSEGQAKGNDLRGNTTEFPESIRQ